MRSSSSPRRAAVVSALLFGGFAPSVRAQTILLPPAPTTLAPPPPSSNATRPLVWVGASLFTFSYLASAVGATTGYDTADGTSSERAALWIPAVGPFIMMGSTKSAGIDVLLALDGLAQIGGFTMFVYGLRGHTSAPPRGDADLRLKMSLAPLVARGASGASVVATF